jgi:hypothetical protein
MSGSRSSKSRPAARGKARREVFTEPVAYQRDSQA